MEISKISSHQAFCAKFINNKAFREVVNYADKTKQLRILDSALYDLSKANRENIIIIHGKNENATVPIFSNFTIYKDGVRGYRDTRSVQNMVNGVSSPEEASFNGIIDLASFGRKFKKLFNAEPKTYESADDIIEKYSVTKNI